ncbi:MAG: class I SAM-dependent methyltransferase [Bacteroidales bacterium]|jgi:tRNA (cmo5U34)-methyltransferase
MDFIFSKEKEFDLHISNSIRGYDFLLSDIINISNYFIKDDSNVLDIGSSTGKLLRYLHSENNQASYTGIEPDKNFYIKSKSYTDNINYENISLCDFDWYDNQFDFITMIFTLQFINPNYKKEALEMIYAMLKEHGCFIIAEKIYFENSKIHNIMNSVFYQNKLEKFSAADILEKEHSLRKMMTNNTSTELTNMLKNAGFRHIEQIWQNFMFVGYMVIK